MRAYCSMLRVLTVCAATAAYLTGTRETVAEPAPAPDWGAVVARAQAAGGNAAWSDTFRARCEFAGLLPAQASLLLDPLETARRQNLPTEPVQSKLEEGLVKRATPEAITAAVSWRQQELARAAALVSASGYAQNGEGWRQLTVAGALALEGGLATEDLASVLERGGGRRTGQVQASIESGEALARAGYRSDVTCAFMLDCMNRDLRRSEILRITRITQQKCRPSTSISQYRTTVWGDAINQSDSGKRQMGPDRNPGTPDGGQGDALRRGRSGMASDVGASQGPQGDEPHNPPRLGNNW